MTMSNGHPCFCRVCISDVREEGGLATLKELREKFGEKKVTFVQCDVTKPEQFAR